MMGLSDPHKQQRPAGDAEQAPPPRLRRPKLSVDQLRDGVLAGDRSILARALTLIESNAPGHIPLAQELLSGLLPHTGNALRIGITGVPGAGKSTLIETFGLHLVKQGHRVAVLAVDPSSTISKGSILGDKTRMEKLAHHPSAFIRPSPSGGTLGGVARKSREAILLCEAAGFDIILVETVGVGQSEVTIRSMTDFFLFLAIAGAGDELQGMKKGVLELADVIVVNKADGDNYRKARMAKAEYNRVLGFLSPATDGWQTKAMMTSALNGSGIPELWEHIRLFRQTTQGSGVFNARRVSQQIEWFRSAAEAAALEAFYAVPGRRQEMQALEIQVAEGKIPVTAAVRKLF